jgi:prefoldin subunit 5
MLSCYETGAQLPSMQSLASTLKALNADFHELQDALDQVQEQQPELEEEEALMPQMPKKGRKKAAAKG